MTHDPAYHPVCIAEAQCTNNHTLDWMEHEEEINMCMEPFWSNAEGEVLLQKDKKAARKAKRAAKKAAAAAAAPDTAAEFAGTAAAPAGDYIDPSMYGMWLPSADDTYFAGDDASMYDDATYFAGHYDDSNTYDPAAYANTFDDATYFAGSKKV